MEIEMESQADPSCSTDIKDKRKKHDRSTKAKKSLEQRQGGEGLGTKKPFADPNCKHASNPYHSCGPHCSPKNSHPSQFREVDVDVNHVITNERRKEIAKGKAKIAEPNGIDDVKTAIVEKKIVNPNCINASNPYHVCGSYCLSRDSKKGQTYKGVRVASNQPSRYVNVKGGNSNSNSNSNFNGNSKCKNASNPYHKCAEYCFNTPSHDGQPKKERMEKGKVHSSSVDAFNPAKNHVKALESSSVDAFIPATNHVQALESKTGEGDDKLRDNDNKRNSWSSNEQDLVEKVGILKENEHDLEASNERDLYLKEIDSFDFHPQSKKSAIEEKEIKKVEKMEVLQQKKINTSKNSYSKSAPNLLKKLPKSSHLYGNRKAISSSASPFHFGLLLISVVYYIAHVIITGAVFPEGKTNARIEYKEQRMSNEKA